MRYQTMASLVQCVFARETRMSLFRAYDVEQARS